MYEEVHIRFNKQLIFWVEIIHGTNATFYISDDGRLGVSKFLRVVCCWEWSW